MVLHSWMAMPSTGEASHLMESLPQCQLRSQHPFKPTPSYPTLGSPATLSSVYLTPFMPPLHTMVPNLLSQMTVYPACWNLMIKHRPHLLVTLLALESGLFPWLLECSKLLALLSRPLLCTLPRV